MGRLCRLQSTLRLVTGSTVWTLVVWNALLRGGAYARSSLISRERSLLIPGTPPPLRLLRELTRYTRASSRWRLLPVHLLPRQLVLQVTICYRDGMHPARDRGSEGDHGLRGQEDPHRGCQVVAPETGPRRWQLVAPVMRQAAVRMTMPPREVYYAGVFYRDPFTTNFITA